MMMDDVESLPVVKGLRVEVQSLREAFNAEKERSAAALAALVEIRDGYGPNHTSKFARDKAASAIRELEAE